MSFIVLFFSFLLLNWIDRLAFGKVWYDLYDRRRERKISLVLRKNHLRGKLQHRVPEFTIIDNDEASQIGRIYLYSTDLQRTEYGQAVAVKGSCFLFDRFTSHLIDHHDCFSAGCNECWNKSHIGLRCPDWCKWAESWLKQIVFLSFWIETASLLRLPVVDRESPQSILSWKSLLSS